MKRNDASRLESALADPAADLAGELSGLVDTARRLRHVPQQTDAARKDVAFAVLRGALGRERRRRAQPAGAPAFRSPRMAGTAAAILMGVVLAGVLTPGIRGGGVSEAVQNLFTDEADLKVAGVIAQVSDGQITVDTGSETVTVIIDATSSLTGGDKNPIGFSELEVGQRIEVKGDHQPDGTLVASRLKVESGR